MTRHPRHRGYVLLMTLLVLAIAAAATASVCRMSLAKALRAAKAEDELQRRWGSLTCRAVLLPKAEQALATSPTPAVEVRREIRLGRQAFVLVFGDEQAKANVNVLFRRGGRAEVERAVRELAVAAGGSPRIDLRPRANAAADPDAEEPAFEAMGQVFGDASPAEWLARRGPAGSLSAQITCWGDGMLNVARATAPAAQQACRPFLGAGQVQRLLVERDKAPAGEFDLEEALDKLKVSGTRRDGLDELLDVESTCHSLWVVARDANGREWYDLAVAGTDGDESEVVYCSW